jgi:hypothetical protein
MSVLLDRFMPEYDVYERHTLAVTAPPEEVIRAARGLRPRDVPLTAALMTLRGVPGMVRRRKPLINMREPVIDQFLQSGFVLLADEREELVIGSVGRFWSSDGGVQRVPRGEFAGFSEPGYAKGAMNIRADGATVTTETRVQATDDEARRVFSRYWRVIKLGSAAIRLELLRAIKRRAERGA